MKRTTTPARRTRGVLGGRSDDVVRRVLAAAVAELAEAGYGGFRMSRVAARAGVNKTTLYRRWPSRAALVGAIVERLQVPLRETRLPDTGVLERDLVEAFARRFAVGRTVEGRAWARLLDARHDPELATIVGGAFEARGAEWRSMVTRAVGRGELPRGTDAQLVLDVVRLLVDGRGSTPRRHEPAWLLTAVRTAIAGARAGALAQRPAAKVFGR